MIDHLRRNVDSSTKPPFMAQGRILSMVVDILQLDSLHPSCRRYSSACINNASYFYQNWEQSTQVIITT